MRSAAHFGIALALLSGNATSQGVPGVDAFFGTWTLDGARSHYGRGAPPEQMNLVIESDPEGLAYRSDTYLAGGRMTSSHFVARLDATPALVVGTAGFLAPVALTVVADGGIDAVYTSGLKKVAWSHWSVKNDGNELVIVTTYLTPQGEPVANIAAFRRSESR